MRTTLLNLCLLAAFAVSAQTVQWYESGQARTTPQEVKSPAYQAAYNQTQLGYATYYADYLAGQPTAYGETYQPQQLTASHAVLPLGTILRVTRLDNQQSVDVRVNDKAPLCDGCVISLSRAAADQIGLTTVGKARVSVTRTGFSNWNPRPQRMTNTATARNVAAVPTYGRSQSYPQTNTQQPSTYYPPSTTVNVRTPVQQPGVIRPNSLGQSQPDFGDAYDGRRGLSTASGTTNDPTAFRPASSADRNAYERATLSPAPTTASRQTTTLEPYRPAVIQKEVVGNSRPPVYPNYNPGPSVYQPSRTATELAPVSEVQVASNPIQNGYAVQLAAYGNAANAMRQVRSLQAQGIDNIYLASVARPDGSTLNRVLVGPYTDMGNAQSAADNLKRDRQLTGIVIQLR